MLLFVYNYIILLISVGSIEFSWTHSTDNMLIAYSTGNVDQSKVWYVIYTSWDIVSNEFSVLLF